MPVQTCFSSVSGIWKAPSTVRVSPTVTPRTVAGTAVLGAQGGELRPRGQATTETTARPADSLNRAVNGVDRDSALHPTQPRPPAQAGLGQGDRQAAVGEVVRAGQHARGRGGSDEDRRASVRRRDRRPAAGRPDAGGRPRPRRTRRTPRASCRAARPRRPSAAKPTAEPLANVVVDAEHADHRGRVDRGGARLVVEADVAAGDRDAEGLAAVGEAADGLGELPHDRRVLRGAEVEAVGDGDRDARRSWRRSGRPRRARAGCPGTGRACSTGRCRRWRARCRGRSPRRRGPGRRLPASRARCCRAPGCRTAG